MASSIGAVRTDLRPKTVVMVARSPSVVWHDYVGEGTTGVPYLPRFVASWMLNTMLGGFRSGALLIPVFAYLRRGDFVDPTHNVITGLFILVATLFFCPPCGSPDLRGWFFPTPSGLVEAWLAFWAPHSVRSGGITVDLDSSVAGYLRF